MNRFLVRSWVYPFYKTYSGFLFIFFLLVAGFLKVEEHIAMACFFTSHILYILFPIAGFVLYEWMTIHFSINWISNNRNRTIREVIFWGFWPRLRSLLPVIFYLQVPVIIYTVFLLCIALVSGQVLIFLAVLISGMSRMVIYFLVIDRTIIFPKERQYKNIFRFSLVSTIHFSIINFSLRYIFTQRMLSFLITKLISIGILLVSILIIGTVDYYDRFTAVAIFTVFIANTFLPYALFEFYNIDLNFFRNLPVKPGIILFQTVLILLILNLPEIIILHKNFSQIISSGLIALHVIVGLAALILLYAYLMYFNIDLKTYIIRIFWGSIFIYFLLLFDIPGYLLALVFLTLTIYFYFRGFYKFEMIYNQLKDR